FAPEDFTEGAHLDERYEWPVSYSDLAPYYELAEAALVVTAGQPFANFPQNTTRFRSRPPADWRDLAAHVESFGHHLGSLPMAKGTPWMIAARGTEFSSYHSIVAPLLTSDLFTLVRGAQVTRLNWNSAKQRVESVEYTDRVSRRLTTMRGRAVVLAAGAVDTTTILLRSVSSEFPQGIGNSRGLIGRYLHDHPKEWWPATPSHRMSALAHPMYLSRQPYDPANPLVASSLTIGLTSHRINTYLRRKTRSFGVQVFGTMIPRPDVGVSLPKAAGAAEESRPLINLRYDQAAIDNMVHARQRLRDVFASAGTSVAVDGPFHSLMPGSSFHFGGTVRMHRSPEFGALDGWNQLYDAPNVIVCDSSCFTTGPEKNPTLTAMAIAARAGDHLADDLL
ncbi:MAG TPA: hypothetical protein DCQ04_11260, partial [Actinobacteria bacterium]|nr:hypothetical protein [Actinomycetota bacterium]